MMDASCHLELNRTGQDQSIVSPKEQSTLSCPDINLSAVAFNPGVLIENFKANANISISKDSEKLDIQSTNVPANLTNANIQMNAGGKLLGGELLLPEFDLNLNAPSHGYLVLQGLSLAQLIAIQPQVGLYADGTFDGVLPVDLIDGKVSVSGGRLAARAPGGLITLSDNPAVDQMRTSQPYLDFAFSTLEHLEYSELASTFDMEPSGDAILNVNVKGHTIGIERPIHLNYSQEENMLLLLKSLQIGDKLQTQIEQSMN
ncbi:YdbH domain-containing protein [Shewanella woodyi]|uniref:YdbH domain-containing protein n=1 Tax=Shewanella woodyi TaxID=60961 RepID=UPI003747B3E3